MIRLELRMGISHLFQKCNSSEVGTNHRVEGDHHDDGEIYRRPAARGGFELPMREGVAGVPVEPFVYAAQHADLGDGTIGADDGAQGDCAPDVLAHELERISGIDFVQSAGRREIVGAGGVVKLGEAKDPAATCGIEVGHVQGHRVKGTVPEDLTLELAGQSGGGGTARNRRRGFRFREQLRIYAVAAVRVGVPGNR